MSLAGRADEQGGYFELRAEGFGDEPGAFDADPAVVGRTGAAEGGAKGLEPTVFGAGDGVDASGQGMGVTQRAGSGFRARRHRDETSRGAREGKAASREGWLGVRFHNVKSRKRPTCLSTPFT